MAERKYYWLKLKEDFFESKRIKKLRKMAGGDTMTIIYLKMQLKSIKTDGVLTFTGLESNFAEELALDLDETPEDVGLTLNYLVAVGLIESSDNINFLLPYAVECIGSEGSSAERMRRHRESKKLEASQSDAGVTDALRDRYVEIEKEIEIEKDKPAPKKPVKHKYGEYHQVLLSDEDMAKLRAEFPDDLDVRIRHLDEYIEETGKTYKNHALTIRRWASNDAKQKPGGETRKVRRLGERD